MTKEIKKNQNEAWKTILALLFGIALVSASWYYVENYNQNDTDEKEVIKEEAADQLEVESDVLLEEQSLIMEEKDTANDMPTLVSCLKDNNVVIYGNKSCPACAALAESFGGYSVIDNIYIECTEEREKCNEEKETNYVPEVQIGGDVYRGNRSPSELALATNCPF